jgi:hypothetical protein
MRPPEKSLKRLVVLTGSRLSLSQGSKSASVAQVGEAFQAKVCLLESMPGFLKDVVRIVLGHRAILLLIELSDLRHAHFESIRYLAGGNVVQLAPILRAV